MRWEGSGKAKAGETQWLHVAYSEFTAVLSSRGLYPNEKPTPQTPDPKTPPLKKKAPQARSSEHPKPRQGTIIFGKGTGGGATGVQE